MTTSIFKGQPPLKRPRLNPKEELSQDIELNFPKDILLQIFKYLNVYCFFRDFQNYALVSKYWCSVTYIKMAESDILEGVESKKIHTSTFFEVFKEAVSQRIRACKKVDLKEYELNTKGYSQIHQFKEYLISYNGNKLFVYNWTQKESTIIECKASICTLCATEEAVFCGLITNEIFIYSLPSLDFLKDFKIEKTICKMIVNQELLFVFFKNGVIKVFNKNDYSACKNKFPLDFHLDRNYWDRLVLSGNTFFWAGKTTLIKGDDDYLFFQSDNITEDNKFFRFPLGKCSSNICVQNDNCYFIKNNFDEINLPISSSFCIHSLRDLRREIQGKAFTIEGITTSCQLLVIRGVFAVVARTYQLPHKPTCRSLEIYNLYTQKRVYAMAMENDFVEGGLSFSKGKIFCLTNNSNFLRRDFNTKCHVISFPLINPIEMEERGK